jgi:arabinan endo-1,5-alpha-L-arabinosidase
MTTSNEIHFRDPFVLVEDGIYTLYGTSGEGGMGADGRFQAYRGTDLEHWDGPFTVFQRTADFWADRDFWAPEVHRHGDAYYLFASFRTDGARRGTQILKADHPLGPFTPWSDGPVTPRDWECLDGTFHVDEEGAPWMIFCHEWVQAWDGEMCAVRLTPDLRAAASAAVTLFKASEADWAARVVDGYVTDGPFLLRLADGSLGMLWSSLGKRGYAIGLAVSTGGGILGPWRQETTPVFGEDGGHGMVFTDLDGKKRLAIHQPNAVPDERPVFLPFDR